MIMYDNSMYMEAGGYDLVIRDLRMSIPTRQVAWPFSRINFNSPRVEGKERRKREKKFEKYRRANLPSIKNWKYQTYARRFQGSEYGWPLQAGPSRWSRHCHRKIRFRFIAANNGVV